MRTVRSDAYDDDDVRDAEEGIARDGESVRTPLVLMDSVQRQIAATFDADSHRPHFARPTADARAASRAAYDEMCARLREAYKMPHRDAAEPDRGTPPAELMRRHLRTEPDDNAQARRDRQWAEYCDRVSNAWRTDPRAATAIERQREQWTRER
jgi:hypothetical protein